MEGRFIFAFYLIFEMRTLMFILIAISVGCTKHPIGQDYIYTNKDDMLSLQGKVDLLQSSAVVEDDALLYAISILYAQNDNIIEAKESISKAIKMNPLNSGYHLQLAKYNAELAQNYKAYEEAKTAFELGAYDSKLEALIARMSIETSDTIRSKEFVTKYYTSNRNKIGAQILMARMHLLEKEFQLAEEMASQVLKHDSLNYQGLKVNYAVSQKMDSSKLAILYGNRLLSVDSTNAKLYFDLAVLYLKQDQFANAARYFSMAYQYQNQLPSLHLAIGTYGKLAQYDSVLYYTDSAFAGINYKDKYVLLARARAFNKRYKFEDSYLMYNEFIKMDSTDSLVNAEQAIVLRKIAYLQRKKREQKQLADSLAGSMPIINF